MIIGFVIWILVCLIFVGIGISAFRSEEPVGFWSNGKTIEVAEENVTAYNRAMGKLWCAFGITLAFWGFPLLFAEQNSPAFIPVILGVPAQVIALMVIYTVLIEPKYKKK